jgi:hypothetical protein
MAIPLTDLLQKDHEWRWEEREQTSFDLHKSRLTNTPLLQYARFDEPFIVATDASGYAIFAIGTKYTPYELLFGRIANIPGKLQQTPQPLYNFDDIVLNMKHKCRNAGN